MDILSEPQPTIEAAQALHVDQLFNNAAVFQTAGGAYVYGCLRDRREWPPHTAAQRMAELGYTMVSVCDPLFQMWKPYRKGGNTQS